MFGHGIAAIGLLFKLVCALEAPSEDISYSRWKSGLIENSFQRSIEYGDQDTDSTTEIPLPDYQDSNDASPIALPVLQANLQRIQCVEYLSLKKHVSSLEKYRRFRQNRFYRGSVQRITIFWPNTIEVEMLSSISWCNYTKRPTMYINSIKSDSLERNYMNTMMIEMSDNKIKEIDASAFYDFANLKVLGLRNCQIRTLNRLSFAYVTELQIVDLSDNDISQLHGDLFKHSRKLRFVNVSINHLDTFPDHMFQYNDNLLLVDASFNFLQHLLLSIWPQTSQLEQLLLSYNLLESLDEGAFQKDDQYTFLRKLSIDHNRFSELPGNNFRSINGLTNLCLCNNNISHLGDDSLRSLRSLQELKLSNTGLTSFNFNSLMRYASQLQSIDLSNNRITDLGASLPIKQCELKFLKLRSNTIDQFPVMITTSCRRIGILGIEHNRIQSIPDYAFVNSSFLRTALLYDNMIMSIGNNTLRGLKRLEYLDLKDNLIQTIDEDAFVDLTNLIFLEISRNKIEMFHGKNFRDMSKLKYIRATGNKLREINLGHLMMTGALMQVNFNRNQIEIFINDINSSAETSIEQIFLINNKIKVIPPGVFRNFKKAFILDISNNKMTSIQGLQNTTVVALWINNSSLPLSDISGLSTCPQLSFLEAQNIGLTEMPDICPSMSSLVTLNLANNWIKTVSLSAFSSCDKLEQVYLTENPIETSELDISSHIERVEILDVRFDRRRLLVNVHPQTLYSLPFIVPPPPPNASICN